MDIEPTYQKKLVALFKCHTRMHVAIDAVLEGHHGTICSDSEDRPQVASIVAGDIVLFAGDPSITYARELVSQTEHAILVSPSPDWTRLIYDIHGENITVQDRYDFSSDTLNPSHLETLSRQFPEHVEIKRIDKELAHRIRKDVTPDLVSNYASPDDFVQRGVGFCAIHRDQIVCGATSYVHSEKSIEIEIDTHRDYRRRGIATVVSASLILHCISQGIDPHWDAGGVISANLARKLGYRLIDSYEMYFV